VLIRETAAAAAAVEKKKKAIEDVDDEEKLHSFLEKPINPHSGVGSLASSAWLTAWLSGWLSALAALFFNPSRAPRPIGCTVDHAA
jgi:hypothetical protein